MSEPKETVQAKQAVEAPVSGEDKSLIDRLTETVADPKNRVKVAPVSPQDFDKIVQANTGWHVRFAKASTPRP